MATSRRPRTGPRRQVGKVFLVSPTGVLALLSESGGGVPDPGAFNARAKYSISLIVSRPIRRPHGRGRTGPRTPCRSRRGFVRASPRSASRGFERGSQDRGGSNVSPIGVSPARRADPSRSRHDTPRPARRFAHHVSTPCRQWRSCTVRLVLHRSSRIASPANSYRSCPDISGGAPSGSETLSRTELEWGGLGQLPRMYPCGCGGDRRPDRTPSTLSGESKRRGSIPGPTRS